MSATSKTANINLAIHGLIGFCYSASFLDKYDLELTNDWTDTLVKKAKELESLLETDEWKSAIYPHYEDANKN